jgi:PAS domain S-box-containing protein
MIWWSVLPLIALAVYFAFDHVRTLQAEREREALHLADNVAVALDRHIGAQIAALRMLADSPLMDDLSRLDLLYREAQGFVQNFGGHVILADPSMQMLFNTRVPLGAPLPKLPRPSGQAAAPTALETGRPAVGDIVFGPVAEEPLVAVSVPAIRDGRVAFLLLATVETSEFQERLDKASVPPGWAIAVLDGIGATIARRAPPGFEIPSPAEEISRRFAVRSAVSPWSVLVEIPVEAYRQAILETAEAIFVALLASILGATVAGRRLARSVATLAEPSPSPIRPVIAEIEAVRQALVSTAAARDAAQSSMRESEAQLRNVFEQAADGIFIITPDHRYIDANPAGLRMLGYSRDELFRLRVFDVLAEHERPRLDSGVAKMMSGTPHLEEWEYRRKDGTTFPAEVSARPHAKDRYVAIVRDLTTRKAAERQRLEREERLRLTVRVGRIGLWDWGLETNKVFFSPEWKSQIGYEDSEIADDFEEWSSRVHPDDLDATLARVQAFRNGQEADLSVEFRFRHKDGSYRWIFAHAELFRNERGKPVRMIGSHVDVTEIKKMALELRDSEERFRGLVEQSLAGIYVIQDEKLSYVNPRFAELLGYGPGELLGTNPDDFILPEDRPTRHAVRDALRESRKQAAAFSVRARRKDGTVIELGIHGVRAVYAGKPAILGMAQDITESQRAKERAALYLNQLEVSMLGTVRSVSTMMDKRDPYTAGHQRRVGLLARAIGAEMGLSEDRLKGLELTGLVHDIGKISVPAEVLSKPGRLTEFEFGIIRQHPQAGHEIIRDVAFPWPIAEIIWQHHERLDGSGYPRGLKGDEIILEARIMVVADVVEAMSSHRPYRPALGIDAALEEIARNSGRFYDPDAATACLRLFREKGYAPPQ